MNHILTRRTASKSVVMAIGLLLSVGQAQAATIYASGQRLISAVPGVHDDLRENFIYALDSSTGIATPVSPETTGLPSALAGTADGGLLGFASGGQLVEIASALLVHLLLYLNQGYYLALSQPVFWGFGQKETPKSSHCFALSKGEILSISLFLLNLINFNSS